MAEDQRARFAAYALYRRSSEATTLCVHLDALLDGQGQTRPVILLGDMNDEPDAATTLILDGAAWLGDRFGRFRPA